MFGVSIMRFTLKIEVWDSGLGLNLGFRFRIQVYDAGLGIQV